MASAGASVCVLVPPLAQFNAIDTAIAPFASETHFKQANDAMDKALAPKYWAPDGTLTKDGGFVFDRMQDAASQLMKVKSPASAVAAAQAVVDSLLKLSVRLATDAIQYAIDHAGTAKEIDAAQKEMAAAQKELDKSNFDAAISHFGNAWDHAWKAVH